MTDKPKKSETKPQPFTSAEWADADLAARNYIKEEIMSDKPRKSEPRIWHVNGDHLWTGVNHGYQAALEDCENPDCHENFAVAVVKKEDFDALKQENEELRRALEFWPQFMDMFESSPSDVSDFHQFTNEFYEVRAALKGRGSNV